MPHESTARPRTPLVSTSSSSSSSVAAPPSSPTLSARKRALSNASQGSEASYKRHLSVDPTTADSPSDIDSLGASRLDIESTPEPLSPSSQLVLDVNFAMNDDDELATSHSAAGTTPSMIDDELPSYTSSTLASAAVTPSATADEQEDEEPDNHDDDDISETLAPTDTPPDGSNQLALIQDWLRDAQQEMAHGDRWYLVSRSWYRRWQTACSGVPESKDDFELTIDELGPIDNSDILVDGKLKRPVEDGRDVVLLPTQAWDFLVKWYGRLSCPIERQVVCTGGPGSERVEFYPPTFEIVKVLPSESLSTNVSVPMFESTPTLSLSSGAKVQELKELTENQFGLSRETRLWRLPADEEAGSATPLLDGPAHIFAEKLSKVASAGASIELVERADVTSDSTLNDAMLTDELTRLAIEEQNEDGKWLVDESALASTSTSGSSAVANGAEQKKKPLFGGGQFFDKFAGTRTVNQLIPRSKNYSNGLGAAPSAAPSIFASIGGALTRSKSQTRGGQRGLTGLTNLGNTCFMNSALQCMSNTKELQEYFSSGVYKSEINRTNPLGMRGQVAEGFGQLIERLWSTSGGAYAPREFKQALSRFAPQFSGYGQQDTQELLAFLLDGVHEDLNRIKKKPPTNAPDWEGGGDQEMVELAKTCWEQYRSRNDSVIVDLFQGQYRSTVVCPDCDKVSITFDPFMYVTTNLPVFKKWTGTIFFVPLDPTRPRYAVDVELPKSGTIKTAKAAVGKLVDCDPKRIVAIEEWHGKLWKAWFDDDMISEVNTSNDRIVFWETSAPYAQPKPRFYGKAKPAVAPSEDAPILIAVQHKKGGSSKADSVHRPFGASHRGDGDSFGSPFILSLTREQASSIEGITRALTTQYARVSKRGDELHEYVELEADGAPSAAAAPTSTNSIPAPLPAGELPPTPPPEASMDVDSEASTSALPSIINSTPSTSTAASSSATSTSTTPRSRGPFRILVSKQPHQKSTIPLNQSDYNSIATVPLETRLPREPSPETDMFATQPSTTSTHIPGAFFTGDEETGTAMSTDAETEAPAVVATTETPAANDHAKSSAPSAPKKPLVSTGDFFYVEWEPVALAHFFGGDGTGDNASWDQVEQIVDPVLAELRSRPKGAGKKTITIEDCLNEFTKEERLGEDDTWYCPVCKKHQQATKKVELWKVPDVLVFAFKRFSANRYSRDKIDEFVDFPLEGFDMEPFVEGVKVERRLAGETGSEEPESLIYDLYAVDNHYGGMGGGHYTAYAKNHENGKWYDFDDSRVSEIGNPEAVKTKAAYLCFYRRRTTRPIGAKSRELIDSAIQSRNASAANSDAGIASGPNSLTNSPFGSTDNLATTSSAPTTFPLTLPYSSLRPSSNVDDDEDDLYGDSTISSTVRPKSRYMGMFPSVGNDSSSSSSDSDVAERGSPPMVAAIDNDWNGLMGTDEPEFDGIEADEPVVEVKLADEDTQEKEPGPGVA